MREPARHRFFDRFRRRSRRYFCSFAYLGLLSGAACSKEAVVIATAPKTDIIVTQFRPGTVRIAHGCTYLDTAERAYTLVWPHGYRWVANPGVVISPTGERFSSGQYVIVTGGDGSIATLEPAAIREHLVNCGAPYTIASHVKQGERR